MALEMTLARLCELVSGQPAADYGKQLFSGVSIDAGAIRGGELFVSCEGSLADEQFAYMRGAAAILTTNQSLLATHPEASSRLIQVADPVAALSALGVWWFTEQSDVQVVVVMGSIGKTSVKEIIARMLVARGRGTYTPASRSSVSEIAMTLCQLGPDDTWLVLEATQAALPLLSQIEIDSLVYLGEDPALAGQLLSGIPGDTAFVLSRELADACEQKNGHQVTTCGANPAANVRIANLEIIGIRATRFTLQYNEDAVEVFLTVPGAHVAFNVAAATAAVLQVFPETSLAAIADSVRNMNPLESRLYLHRLPGGRYLFDDSAHASLPSIDALCTLMQAARSEGLAPGIICSDLDSGGEEEHRDYILRIIAQQPLCIIAVGTYAQRMAEYAETAGAVVMVTASAEAAAHTARKFPWQALFVKGGQKVQLKRAVNLILELEGEVLEIPEDLAQFGSAETKEE